MTTDFSRRDYLRLVEMTQSKAFTLAKRAASGDFRCGGFVLPSKERASLSPAQGGKVEWDKIHHQASEALRLKNPDLVKEALGHSKEFYEMVLKVKVTLEEKSQRLLSYAAASLTLMATVGSLLLTKLPDIPNPTGLSISFAGGGVLFLGAIFFFFRAQSPSGFHVMGLNEIADQNALYGSDDGEGLVVYHRYLAKMYLCYGTLNQGSAARKRETMRWGEWLFMGGLASLIWDMTFFASAALF